MPLRALAVWSLALVPMAALAGPEASVRVEDVPTEPAKVDLKLKGAPLSEVLEKLAKALGFPRALVEGDELPALKVTCSWTARPAWECVVELARAHGFAFNSGKEGELRAARVPADRDLAFTYATAPGLVVCLAQRSAGAAMKGSERPALAWVIPEPRLAWTCKGAKLVAQADAKGKACAALALVEAPGGITGMLPLGPGADGWSPWPGLRSLTVGLSSSFVKRRRLIELRGLEVGCAPTAAEHEGKEVLRLDAVRQADRFVDVVLSLASAEKPQFVVQGRPGVPVWDMTAEALGARVEAFAGDASFTPAVVTVDGDGTRVTATLRYTPHQLDGAGGLAALVVRSAAALESVSREDQVVLAAAKK